MVRKIDGRESDIYNGSVAVPAKRTQNKSLSERSPLQLTAIRLYSDGQPRRNVAKLLAPHAFPKIYRENPEQAHRQMRKQLRSWEETQWFRDAVYDSAIIGVDADLPAILKGMRRRARRRVDAARLMLEVTGRHNPRGEAQTPAVVQINFGTDIPRPQNRLPAPEDPDVVEGEIVDEE